VSDPRGPVGGGGTHIWRLWSEMHSCTLLSISSVSPAPGRGTEAARGSNSSSPERARAWRGAEKLLPSGNANASAVGAARHSAKASAVCARRERGATG